MCTSWHTTNVATFTISRASRLDSIYTQESMLTGALILPSCTCLEFFELLPDTRPAQLSRCTSGLDTTFPYVRGDFVGHYYTCSPATFRTCPCLDWPANGSRHVTESPLWSSSPLGLAIHTWRKTTRWWLSLNTSGIVKSRSRQLPSLPLHMST